MAQLVADLTGEIRSAAAPARNPGFTAPSTADRAQSPATTTPVGSGAPGRQADFPVEGVGGPARRDQANHHNWKLQAGMEIKSYAESIAVRDIEAGAMVVVDPSVASIWRISAAGSFSIQVPELPARTIGGVAASRVVSLVLYVQRVAGAEITWPIGALAGTNLLDPDGNGDRSDSMFAPPDAGRLDVFVMVHVPTIGWHVSISALGLSAI